MNYIEKQLKNKTIAYIYELSPRYDSRASFYGKAHVIEYTDGTKALKSYDTIVAYIDENGHYRTNGCYSQTTSRHQHDFALQFAKTYIH